jgi:hypothetical protein
MTDLTALTAITTPSTTDIVYVVNDPASTKSPKKCSIANLVKVADLDASKLTTGTLPLGRLTGITTAELASNAGIVSGQLATGIDATKIADGSVTSTEFKYINTLSDNAQTQIDGKSPTAGNTSLTTVGTIATGSWNATAIPTSKILNFDTEVQANRLDQMASPSAAVALGSQKITGLANGVAADDAATKGQLDTAVASNITLKGGYDAANDNPHLDSGTRVAIAIGDHYVVTVAGTFYSEVLQAGDSLISTVASPTSFGQWIITNNNVVTPIVTANIADEAVTEAKIYVSNAGNNGEFLSKQSGDNGGLTWATVPAGYNAPTIGTTGIGSGASVPSLAGLTNITATGALTGGQLTIDNLTINANKIQSTNSNGHVELDANGSGVVKVLGDAGSNDGAITLNCRDNSHGQTIKSQPHSASASNTLLLPTTASNAQSTLVSEISTQTLTNKTLGTGTAVTLGSDATLDIYYRSSTGALARLAKGSAGEALKINAANNALEWGTAGGLGAELTTTLQASTYSAGEQSPATEGSSPVSIFVKTIDANNQGLYIRLKKNAGYQDVQIA